MKFKRTRTIDAVVTLTYEFEANSREEAEKEFDRRWNWDPMFMAVDHVDLEKDNGTIEWGEVVEVPDDDND